LIRKRYIGESSGPKQNLPLNCFKFRLIKPSSLCVAIGIRPSDAAVHNAIFIHAQGLDSTLWDYRFNSDCLIFRKLRSHFLPLMRQQG
jgi:hypothetical protein